MGTPRTQVPDESLNGMICRCLNGDPGVKESMSGTAGPQSVDFMVFRVHPISASLGPRKESADSSVLTGPKIEPSSRYQNCSPSPGHAVMTWWIASENNSGTSGAPCWPPSVLSKCVSPTYNLDG